MTVSRSLDAAVGLAAERHLRVSCLHWQHFCLSDNLLKERSERKWSENEIFCVTFYYKGSRYAHTHAYLHTVCLLYVVSAYSMWIYLHLSLFFPAVCVCHVWLKLAPARRLVHPPMKPQSPTSPLLHPSITLSLFSFLLALWQRRGICSLKVPPSLSGSRGWRFLGNSVRVDWVGADRWLPFIGLHH